MLEEVSGNLFDSPAIALAHCVSQDLAMGKGIAKEFRDRFGQVTELKAQQRSVGQVAWIVTADGRFAYYLITKERYFHKPTYESLYQCLTELASLCLQHDVKQLALPKIGCGLDRLNWSRVKAMIEKTLCPVTRVTVYSL